MRKLLFSLFLVILIRSTAFAVDSRKPLRVQTIDGTVSNIPATLKVTNGSLTDNGDGTMTFTPSGSPGGSNTQFQYNNNSSFGGVGSFSYFPSSNSVTISSYTEVVNVSTMQSTAGVYFDFSASTVAVLAEIVGQKVFISTNNVFQVGTSTTMAFTNIGHLEFHASTSPVLSTCGTGPSIAANSSDMTGTFTIGTAASASCTLTFSNPWLNIPQCFANDETSIVAVRVAPTKTNVVFTVTGVAQDSIDYFCIGEQ